MPESPGEEYFDLDAHESSVLPSSSADPTQPLSGGPAMSAALDEIASGHNVRTRRPFAHNNPAETLAQLVAARDRVIAANLAEAERAAATGRALKQRPEKRDRTASNGSQTASGKKTKTDEPMPDAATTVSQVMDMRADGPARNRPTSFEHLRKCAKLWCAIQIGRCPVIGSPVGPSDGVSVKIDIDPGRFGKPSLELSFKVVTPSGESQVDHTFSVGWEPGVKIGGQWMMENLAVTLASNPTDPDWLRVTYPPAIKDHMEKDDNKKEFLLSRLMCLSFQSNIHRSTMTDIEWIKDLQGGASEAAHANLNRMFNHEDPKYLVFMWFLDRNQTLDNFRLSCLNPFVNAVAHHTPPFYQYLDENDEPMIDFNLEKINSVSNNSASTREGEQEQKQAESSVAYAWREPTNSGGPPRKPIKAPKSPADLEMLRLKNRQTLHRLAPS